MSQPTPPGLPTQLEPQPQPLSPPVYWTPRPKQFGWIAVIIAVVEAFGVGAAVLSSGNRGADGSRVQPRTSDFEIGIKILDNKCSGSVGCSVTYRIMPQYVGHRN
jgi:hypothetical protein